MKPVWEEAWTIDDPHICSMDIKHAQLAAQAPAMARLLLEIRRNIIELHQNLHISEGGPGAMRGVWFKGGDAVQQCQHLARDVTKIEKVLKAAGVPTDGSSWGEEK